MFSTENSFNYYLNRKKVELIKEAKKDFFDVYNLNYTPFTKKIFFYFFIYDGKKYVHKKSLNFIYTNADTYTEEISPYFCNLGKKEPIDVIKFLSSCDDNLLLKKVEENEKFLVYDFFEGDFLTHLNKEDFYRLKCFHENNWLTPFYNSMAYNILKRNDVIKMIDFKHFEKKDKKPFFIYMYNQQNKINKLFIENYDKIDMILNHLSKDYPTHKVEIFKH
jgi:hypothetical protein